LSITETMHSALAEVYSRAGASDKDRDLWLAERHGGLTATQIRELYLQGAGYRQKLLHEKANRINEAFVSNQYTAWGNKREPVIAEWARRFGIEPESRVIRAADNPRFLASPDGIGVTWLDELIIDEIKTGKDDLRPGGEACTRKGYLIQMQWGMRVTGARRCLYAWEQHNSDWQDRGGEFLEPEPLNAEPSWTWIDYDPEIVERLEEIANSFLGDLDALVRDLADGVEPLIDDEMDTLAVNLLRFRQMEAEGKKAKESVWKQMLDRAEGCDPFSQESALARVTWSPGEETVAEKPDVEAAKAADPALFAEVEALSKRWNAHQALHMKNVVTPGKNTLTVTAVKQKAAS
jgi:hypothetical protein